MKVGVFSAILSGLPLEQALGHITGLRCDTVELGTGAYPGDAHCKPDELLASEGKLKEFQAAIKQSGLTISSLSCHGNPIHPDRALADEHHAVFQATVKLAAKLGVEVVTTFSGCPGDGSRWREVSELGHLPLAAGLLGRFSIISGTKWPFPIGRNRRSLPPTTGSRKIALEAHPGFLVYNPETMLRLRDATSEVLGANFDPSHFFWQGIDPVKAVRKLGAAGAIHHVHAKDTELYKVNADYDGYLDTKPYSDEINRAWIFRTVGYGHGEEFWRDFVSTLRLVGYEGTLSMEHEDSLMSPNEGLRKGVEFLQAIILRDTKGEVTWA